MLTTFVRLGAINLFLAVALGAFGAHGLEGKITDHYLEIWKTGVQYQMLHGTGILIVALLTQFLGAPKALRAAGYLFQAGIVLFAGSLYILAITGIGWLGAITPLGGVCFLIGWALLAYAGGKRIKRVK
ncbi:hypothetical protein CIG75_01380 [Tumebacillus algifaecis]|uniref:DUF423 domain-containing protein n=1 Tax=Tumebacillus algifaecis TaxID=1214604 RepID=A0A223CX25_9BACL|nr:DUF423 domain-containing protein [Tumebacillus algifaecis]ASS73755.1 hypothetical protein CIG75_01380 [Tumebacillus algifaecis]